MKFDSSGIRGLPEVVAAMKDFSERRLNAALATALTRTAGDVKKALQAALPRVFDRPTPYTMNSLYVRTATADRLAASVYFKDDSATSKGGTPATKYLLPQVESGQRRVKRFERALQAFGALPAGWGTVPGQGALLDAYGNWSRAQIMGMLGQLSKSRDVGPQKRQTATQRKAGGQYFVVKPGTAGRVAPGVYQRELLGRNITPVVLFVELPTYSKRFDFWGLGREEAARRLPAQARQAVHEQRERLNLKRTG